jgi:hypothetical protein
MARAVPHAAAIQRSWSYVERVEVRLGLSHTLFSLRETVRFNVPSDIRRILSTAWVD